MREKSLLNYKIFYIILIMIFIILKMPNNSYAKSISRTQISLSYYSKAYTGSTIKPAVTVKVGDKKLEKGKDYTVSYQNNVNVGTANVTVKGIGKYSGSVTKKFTITKKSIGSASVSLSKYTYTYTGAAKKPTVTVKVNSKILKKDKDYTVSYSNNVKIGTAKVTIKGIGNYNGTLTKTFKITRIPIGDASFFVTLKYDWKGMDVQKFQEKSSDGSFSVKNGKVTAVYYANVGSKNTIYIPKAATNFSSIKMTKLTITSVNNVAVAFDNKKLEVGTDYSVSYSRTSTKVIIKITGKGNYTGTKTIECKAN